MQPKTSAINSMGRAVLCGIYVAPAIAILLISCISGMAQEQPAEQRPTPRSAFKPVEEVQPKPVRPGVVAYGNLDYGGNGNDRQMLDLYIPTAAKGPLPVIVWFYGGGWLAGDKSGLWDEPRYTGSGYAVVGANYRYSSQAVFPAQIEDCKAVIRFLRAQAKKYNLDAAHIGVWGISAGGHLAALLGASNGVKDLEGAVGKNPEQSSDVQAVVDISGPADLTLSNQPNEILGPIYSLIGGTVEKNKAVAAQASPVTHVGKNSAPTLIIHGQDDAIVPIRHAEVFYAALQKAGVETKLLALKDTGHVGGKIDAPETRKEVADFFAKHLKPNKAAPTGAEGDK